MGPRLHNGVGELKKRKIKGRDMKHSCWSCFCAWNDHKGSWSMGFYTLLTQTVYLHNTLFERTFIVGTKLSTWFVASATDMYCISQNRKATALCLGEKKNILARGPNNCCKCGQSSILQCISLRVPRMLWLVILFIVYCVVNAVYCVLLHTKFNPLELFFFNQMLFIYCAFHFTVV